MKKIAYFLLGLTLVACSGKQEGATDESMELAVISVTASDADLNQSYPATIKGVQDIEIRPKVSGHITRVCVDEGAFVSAGQTLFVIDGTQFRAAVNQAQASVNVARTQIATQQLTVNNKKMLLEKQIISQYDYDVAVNQLASLKAQLAQAQAALSSARDQLNFCTVKAPASGVIGTIPYRVGALVSSASQEPLTTVSNLSKMYAYFSMTEKQVLEMTRQSGGSKTAVDAMPSVKLILADGTEYESLGQVSMMSGIIDAATGSVQMRATFDNARHILRSGATGTVRIPIHTSGAIQVPQKAVYAIQEKHFCYVLDKDNKAIATEIQIMPQHDGKNYVVTSGLKVGDRIVAEGVNKVKNEMVIKPITPAQSAAKQKKAQEHMAEKRMPNED